MKGRRFESCAAHHLTEPTQKDFMKIIYYLRIGKNKEVYAPLNLSLERFPKLTEVVTAIDKFIDENGINILRASGDEKTFWIEAAAEKCDSACDPAIAVKDELEYACLDEPEFLKLHISMILMNVIIHCKRKGFESQ